MQIGELDNKDASAYAEKDKNVKKTVMSSIYSYDDIWKSIKHVTPTHNVQSINWSL